MWSVTLDRTSLGLEPLVITGDPSTGAFHLTEEDCTWPAFTMRRTYAPQSEAVSGDQLLAVAGNQGTIGLGFEAHDDDETAMVAAMVELTEATTQFTYPLTLVVHDVTIGTYLAHAEYPNWGPLDSGNVRAKINKGTITIPINPPGSP